MGAVLIQTTQVVMWESQELSNWNLEEHQCLKAARESEKCQLEKMDESWRRNYKVMQRKLRHLSLGCGGSSVGKGLPCKQKVPS